MKKLLFVFALIFTVPYLYAQDSCDLRISLITCGPGDELYATFGHTAIRVRSKDSSGDLVFNYGTFEFQKGFYTKFVKGSLLYSLSVEDYEDFLSVYKEENRTVKEQVLELSCEEKHQLFFALQENAEPRNRYYKYDFLFDNCTTRARNILFNNSHVPIITQRIIPEKAPTFRDLIHSYLDSGKKYWSKFGIDLLLGAHVDKRVTNEQAQFLPEYLMNAIDHSFRNGQKFSEPAQVILPQQPIKNSFTITPAQVFIVLLILIVLLSSSSNPVNKNIVRMFDILLFLLTGIAGILMLTLWLIREDVVCRINYNLIWAFPLNFIMAFFVPFRTHKMVTGYFKFIFYLTLIFLLSFYFLPQHFNLSLIPIWLLIVYRSWYLSKPNQYGRKNNLV